MKLMKKFSKVLIIEDDKFISKAMKHAFEKKSFQVKLAPTIKSGVQILNEWEPDSIVLDLILPEKDGFSFLRETKMHPKWSKIPVIVTSNLAQDPFVEEGENTGYVEYIVKSDLDLGDLVKKVERIISLN